MSGRWPPRFSMMKLIVSLAALIASAVACTQPVDDRSVDIQATIAAGVEATVGALSDSGASASGSPVVELPESSLKRPPDGPGQRIDDLGTIHISSGDDHPPYNSVPATSGWHYGQPLAPTRWGIHDAFLENEVQIHNLEHGGIGISYNCPDGCDELVAQLGGLVDEAIEQGGKVIMSPNPNTESVITLTAWTFLDQFDIFDEDRIRDFVGAHESSPNAPEPNAR